MSMVRITLSQPAWNRLQRLTVGRHQSIDTTVEQAIVHYDDAMVWSTFHEHLAAMRSESVRYAAYGKTDPEQAGHEGREWTWLGRSIAMDTIDHTGTHGFDFLFGTWRIENRRLVGRLIGSEEWETFIAYGTCRPILGGISNIDDFHPEDGGWAGYEGATFRLFDPHRDEWSIYSTDNVLCVLLPPVVGRFVDGTGEFLGDDVLDGRPVWVRFRWTSMTATTAHWEQAFSGDGGETWETNWSMDFTRIS